MKNIKKMKEEFNHYFDKNKGSADDKQSRWEALKIALDTRKFEIQLYWKRASYFWVFIALLLTVYSAIFSETILKSNTSLISNISLIFVGCLGLIFATFWLKVNLGSKYWQENWEDIIACLEDEQIGPLFKIVKSPQNQIHSVTKVNHLLNRVLIGVWIILIIVPIASICYSLVDICYQLAFIIVTMIFFLTLVTFHYLYRNTKSSSIKENRSSFIYTFDDDKKED